MEHKDRAIKAEMLRSEVEEIKANLESLDARLAGLPAGDARALFEKDKAEMTAELAAREKDLAAVMNGGGAESAAIKREMLTDDIADIEENIAACSARLASSSGSARELYQTEISDLREELTQRRKELAELG